MAIGSPFILTAEEETHLTNTFTKIKKYDDDGLLISTQNEFDEQRQDISESIVSLQEQILELVLKRDFSIQHLGFVHNCNNYIWDILTSNCLINYAQQEISGLNVPEFINQYIELDQINSDWVNFTKVYYPVSENLTHPKEDISYFTGEVSPNILGFDVDPYYPVFTNPPAPAQPTFSHWQAPGDSSSDGFICYIKGYKSSAIGSEKTSYEAIFAIAKNNCLNNIDSCINFLNGVVFEEKDILLAAVSTYRSLIDSVNYADIIADKDGLVIILLTELNDFLTPFFIKYCGYMYVVFSVLESRSSGLKTRIDSLSSAINDLENDLILSAKREASFTNVFSGLDSLPII